MNLETVINLFYEQANAENTPAMKAYMKNQFEFLGIKTPERRKLSREFLKLESKKQSIDWSLVEQLWDLPEREFQYLACDYLSKQSNYLKKSDFKIIGQLAQKKSWWDTVDNLDELVGELVEKYPNLKEEILTWSTADNIWLRRLAIDHQLLFKERTDKELLAQVIQNNFGESEFFINKAIGWALREYSKINPQWVANFIEENRDRMAKLSIREASKYLLK